MFHGADEHDNVQVSCVNAGVGAHGRYGAVCELQNCSVLQCALLRRLQPPPQLSQIHQLLCRHGVHDHHAKAPDVHAEAMLRLVLVLRGPVALSHGGAAIVVPAGVVFAGVQIAGSCTFGVAKHRPKVA